MPTLEEIRNSFLESWASRERELPGAAQSVDQYYTQVLKPENRIKFRDLCEDWVRIYRMTNEEKEENGGSLDPERKGFWEQERAYCREQLLRFPKIVDDDEWDNLSDWISTNNYDDGTWYFVDISEEYDIEFEYSCAEDGDEVALIAKKAATKFIRKLPDDVDPEEITVIDGLRFPRYARYVLMRGNSAFRTRLTFSRGVELIPDGKS